MTIVELLVLLLIAALCGAAGQALAGYSLGGCLVSIVVGFIGAWLGALMAREMGLPELLAVNIGGQPFPIVWAVLGSAVFAFLVGLVTRSWRPRTRY
jgi:uncharacterized membrane protein YeaQ/YmgE (transglycosylase-associated protein family)